MAMIVSAPQHSQRHTSRAGRSEASRIRLPPPSQQSPQPPQPGDGYHRTNRSTVHLLTTDQIRLLHPDTRRPAIGMGHHQPHPTVPTVNRLRTNHPAYQRMTRVRQRHITRQPILEVLQSIAHSKYGVGLNHLPSGRFSANAAWLQCTVLAHNLIRWTATIGEPVETLTVARTVRTRILAVPARIVNRSGIRPCERPPAGPGPTSSPAASPPSEPCPPPADPPAAWRPAHTHTGADNPHHHDPLDQHAPTVAPATTSAPIDSFSPSHLPREPDRWFQA